MKILRKKVAARGTRLAYDATGAANYKRWLIKLIKRMRDETERRIQRLFHGDAAEEFYETQVMDASLGSESRIVMNFLTKKYSRLFRLASKPYAEKMVEGQIKSSEISLKRSVKKLRQDESFSLKGRLAPPGMTDVVKASIAENISLIKSIPAEYMQRVNGQVMRAITAGGDLSRLVPELMKSGAITERRARFIAEDQTRKAYNTVNAQRMTHLGIEAFIWLHSGGGQTQRPDHVAMNGIVFRFNDLPRSEKTGERIIPGQEPGCRCTMEPVLEYPDDEEDIYHAA